MRALLALIVCAGCGASDVARNDLGSDSDGGSAVDLSTGGADGGGGASPIAMLPDTTSGVWLFADQLDPGYSDKLVQFAATHFAGTQKMLKADDDRFKAVNANWLLLHYRLGSSSGPVQYIHDDQWSSDWDQVTTHEDWFMHNQNGMRHHESTDDWDINDLSNAGFRDYWVTSVIADMRATGALGVFADSFEAGISGYGVTDPDPRFDGTNPGNPAYWANGDTWLNQKKEYYQYIESAFAQTPERFLFVPNIGAMITGWANIDYSGIDGAMLEGFALGEAPSDWALGMNRSIALTGAGKFIIVQSYPSTVDDRVFLLASYLLMKGNRTFLNMAGSGVNYFPEYEIDLGAPSNALPADVSQDLWNGVYRRDFAKGMVLVNPSDNAVTVTLPQSMQQATPTGGGAVTDTDIDSSNHYSSGSLSYNAVTTLTLQSKTAALLTF